MSQHDTAPPETQEIETHEALALLRSVPVGRLAVVVDGAPDIFPVNHVVDHGTVVFRTAAGTKLSAAHGRPVAFEVDGYDASKGEAWSVVVHGVGRVVYEAEEAIKALKLPIFPWQSGAKPQIVRLIPSTITGRRFRVLGGVVLGGVRDRSQANPPSANPPSEEAPSHPVSLLG